MTKMRLSPLLPLFLLCTCPVLAGVDEGVSAYENKDYETAITKFITAKALLK